MNLSKKVSAVLSCVLITATTLLGCGSKIGTGDNSENNKEKSSISQINISYVKAPLNVPSIIEKKKNLFEEEFTKDNIKVTFPEITEGSKMTEAMAAGSLDFSNCIGATSVILAAANGVDIKIIGMYGRAPKAYTIMSKDPNLKTTADLKGKKVVGPKGTILHQLLLGVLLRENLKISDVEFINMSIPNGVAAMMSKSADIALVAGAAVPQAIEKGAHIITTGEGIVDGITVIAVSGDFAAKHKDLIDRYLSVHEKSLQFIKDNPEETYKLAAEETKLTIDQVKEMYAWYNFDPKVSDSDISELEKTQEFLKENGMLKNTVDIKSLILKNN